MTVCVVLHGITRGKVRKGTGYLQVLLEAAIVVLHFLRALFVGLGLAATVLHLRSPSARL